MTHQLTRFSYRLIVCACWTALFLAASQSSLAQNCKKLIPAGAGLDDAAVINSCLQQKGFAKLKGGTFLLFSPIVFPRNTQAAPVSGVRLVGRGADVTRLVVQSDCTRPFPFTNDPENPNQYQSAIQVVRSPAAEVSGLELDLTNLRESCGYRSNYMIFINRSPNSRVGEVRVKGSPYGSPTYTSGGANGGGILVVNSEGSTIANNEIKDVGFAFEVGSTSAGYAGITITSSGNSLVQNNRIERVAFGINLANGSVNQGYTGNSSGAMVLNNTIIGAANINCATCSQGRGIKLQACGDGSEPPLQKLTIANNEIVEFGGHMGTIGGSGLDLVCGVQMSTFENNRVIGSGTAEFGLQIRSSYFDIPPNPTHHNTFRLNTFISGRGQVYCGDRCVDVNFTHDGPDQIGMRRNGSDRFSSNNATSMRHETDRGCTDYSDAFFLYLDDRPYVRHNESILLTAVGVRPLSTVTFRFKRAADGVEVATHRSFVANRYCIMNQEYFVVDAVRFPPGEYKIFAEYKDGNSNATIPNEDLGTLVVKPLKGN